MKSSPEKENRDVEMQDAQEDRLRRTTPAVRLPAHMGIPGQIAAPRPRPQVRRQVFTNVTLAAPDPIATRPEPPLLTHSEANDSPAAALAASLTYLFLRAPAFLVEMFRDRNR
jgi:hypothetical protein